MGIIANTKQFLAKKATEVAVKTADGVATASVLSPKQLQQIDEKSQRVKRIHEFFSKYIMSFSIVFKITLIDILASVL